MFIWKKPNKSGTYTVKVMEKDPITRKNRLVKTIGTSADPAVIRGLEQEAKDYILSLRDPILPMDYEDPAENDLQHFLTGLSNSQIRVIGPEMIFGRLYDKIGYGALNDEMFRNLVVCRLFNPGSKARTVDYLYRYLGKRYEISAIYRFLDDLCFRKEKDEKGNIIEPEGEDIKAKVEKISFEYTKQKCGGNISVVFYDMTTLYFESSEPDDLRKPGFSKDGKHSCPQIFLGLLVAAGGNPIGYEIYEGNIYEGNTIVPIVEKLAEKHGFSHPVVVADAGLLSKSNIKELQEKGYEFILGARVKNEPQAIKDMILGMRLSHGEVRAIDKSNGTRLIVSMSESRAKNDAHARAKGLARLEKKFKSGSLTKESINNRGYNKYLQLTGEVQVAIDYDKFYADSVWDGIKGYVTNTKLSKEDVISNYSNLWFIERAFRMNKGDLQARPIYHRLRNRIEAHICICFTAYTILLELERLLKAKQSKLTIYMAGELTRTMYQLNYQMPKSGRMMSILLQMDDKQKELYEIVSEACKTKQK